MRYKLLGRTGLRVSEVALGTATFGTGWGWGAEREQSQAIFDRFVEAGGNFLDCADGYQGGQSETLLGEFIRGERDRFVITTKYSGGGVSGRWVTTTGNSRKCMLASLEGSLKRLGTDRVDLFWVHFADGMTPTEEILRGFEEVSRAGKALHVGFSDFPAWRIARAATLAELRTWPSIAAIQIEYSLVERTAERELLPMADALGLAATLWAVLGGGLLSGKYRRGNEEGRLTKGGGRILTEAGEGERRILDAVESIAAARGATCAQIAIAWTRAKALALRTTMIPILGARTPAQLDDNLAALGIALGADEMAQLDSASATPLGFPHDWLAGEMMRGLGSAGKWDNIDKPAHTVA
jgi:aryl-alcohol dehydrogenase-like predicted oxidoreductase